MRKHGRKASVRRRLVDSQVFRSMDMARRSRESHEELLRLMGAYITEGKITFPKLKSYDKQGRLIIRESKNSRSQS